LSEHVIEFEIGKYLVENFRNVPIKELGLFELQVHLNKLAETYSESIVRHAFVNICSITTVRLNVEENQLVNVFGEFCACVGRLKGA
jgi:hypothetical protein